MNVTQATVITPNAVDSNVDFKKAAVITPAQGDSFAVMSIGIEKGEDSPLKDLTQNEANTVKNSLTQIVDLLKNMLVEMKNARINDANNSNNSGKPDDSSSGKVAESLADAMSMLMGILAMLTGSAKSSKTEDPLERFNDAVDGLVNKGGDSDSSGGKVAESLADAMSMLMGVLAMLIGSAKSSKTEDPLERFNDAIEGLADNGLAEVVTLTSDDPLERFNDSVEGFKENA